MPNSPKKNALHILQRLNDQAERLGELARSFPALIAEQENLKRTVFALEQSLQYYFEADEDLEWFFENSLDMKCIITREGYFLRVNPEFCYVLGYTEEELTTQSFLSFVHPDDVQLTQDEVERLLNGVATSYFENRYIDKQGEIHWIAWCCPPFTNDSRRLYAIARDITESKKTQQELLFQAQHDPLTGLFNRATLELSVSQAIQRCDNETDHQIAIIVIDLDGFKAINDTYGHSAGDQVLKELARRFKQLKCNGDIIFRAGGDEFIWLVEQENASNLHALIQLITQALRQPVDYDEMELNVDGSIGICHYPGNAMSPRELVQQADAAMYQIKKAR